MFTEVFFTFFITTIVAFLLAVGRILYKSKCKEVRCGWSGCTIIRDIDAEVELDEATINHTPPQISNQSSRQLPIQSETNSDRI